jgi:DhnA family fructose-bisphosphate aldolase class Ia
MTVKSAPTVWAGRELTPRRKQLIVAIDHGLFLAEVKGLERPFDVVDGLVANPEVDGIIATVGLLKHAQRLGISLSNVVRLLTVDYVAFGPPAANQTLEVREIMVEPEATEMVQPHAFKMFLNIYDDSTLLMRNVRDVERFVAYGQRNQVATLVEVMFFGNRHFADPQTQESAFARGCRIAMEIGADALKVPMIANTEVMAQTIDDMCLPAFVLGGAKHESRELFLAELRRVARLPVCGIMFGRNVWQSPDLAGAIADICAALRPKTAMLSG